jgi:hypothetical protein
LTFFKINPQHFNLHASQDFNWTPQEQKIDQRQSKEVGQIFDTEILEL